MRLRIGFVLAWLKLGFKSARILFEISARVTQWHVRHSDETAYT